jgi:hypothetical protein
LTFLSSIGGRGGKNATLPAPPPTADPTALSHRLALLRADLFARLFELPFCSSPDDLVEHFTVCVLPTLIRPAPINLYPSVLGLLELLVSGSPDDLSCFERPRIPDAFERSGQPPGIRLVQLRPARFEVALEPWSADTQVIARFLGPPPLGTLFLGPKDAAAVNFGEPDWWYVLAARQVVRKVCLTIGCTPTLAADSVRAAEFEFRCRVLRPQRDRALRPAGGVPDDEV